MTDAPERIWLLDPVNAKEFGRSITSIEQPDWLDKGDPPVVFSAYILDTPSALAKSPAVIEMVKAAVEAERERCAELAVSRGIPGHTVANAVARNIAAAIREVPK